MFRLEKRNVRSSLHSVRGTVEPPALRMQRDDTVGSATQGIPAFPVLPRYLRSDHGGSAHHQTASHLQWARTVPRPCLLWRQSTAPLDQRSGKTGRSGLPFHAPASPHYAPAGQEPRSHPIRNGQQTPGVKPVRSPSRMRVIAPKILFATAWSDLQVPAPNHRLFLSVGRTSKHQNIKYRCAIGKTSAGSHVSNSPSARTSYVSGWTSISGQ